MKKFLTSTIVLALVAALLGVFVACGNKTDTSAQDAETAKNAITSVRNLYEGKSKETPESYLVTGVVNVNQTIYNVVWTIESDSPYKSNVTVGEREGTNVSIVVTKASEVINYKLVATVKVGKATETYSFDRFVPASSVQNDDEKEVSIDFTGKTNRTVFTADQQVWTQNGITLTNDKASSITNVSQGDSDYHVRLYQTSNVKIEYPSMIRLIFYSDNTFSYHAQLIEALEKSELGTVTSDTEKATATLALDSPADEIEFVAAKQMRITRIDVIAGKTGLTDEQKANAAISSVSLGQTKFTSTVAYDLSAKSGGLNITWTLKAASDYASIENGKLNITSMPTTETEIVLVASVTSGEVTKTKEFTVTLKPIAGVVNDGSQEHPFTPSEVKAVIAETLAAGATGTVEYYVKGYVIAPGTYGGSQYDNFDDLYIANEAGKATTDATALLVYRPKCDGTYLTPEGFNMGDLVTFKGKFQNYKSSSSDTLTPELVSATCVAREAAERTDADIIAEAKATLTLTKTTFTTAGEEADLPASKSGATISWAVKGTSELVTVTGNKLTIVSIPATSTTVTLTATFTSNSENDTKDYEIKVEPLQTEHAGTQDDPFTIADVKAVGATLANSSYYGGSTAKLVYIKGYFVKIGTFASTSSYTNFTGSWLVDEYADDKDETSDGAVQLYRLGVDTVYVTGENSIAKGDYIVVKGFIQVYSGKVQITYNGSTTPTAVYLQKAGVTKTDAEIVSEAKATVTLATSYEAGEQTLPLTSANGATLAWEVLEGTCVTIDGATMTITAPEAQATVKVKVTITKGDETDTKEFTFTVAPASTKGTEADPYTVAEIEEIFANLSNGQTYQVGGADKLVYICGYVVVAGSDGNYGRDGVKIADSATAADGILIYGHNFDSNLAKGQGLDVGDRVLVSGYLKIFNNTKEIANSTTRPVIKIEQKVELTDEQKAQKALDAVADTLAVNEAGEVALSTATTVEGVTLSWSTEDTTYTVTDNKLNVATLPSMATTVTLTLTATCGEATKTKTVTATIKAAAVNYGTEAAPLSVTAALALAADECASSNDVTSQLVYMTGIVSDAGTPGTTYYQNVYLNDATNSILVYRLYLEGATAPVKNDVLVICGYITNYNGTIEFAYKNNTNVILKSNTRGTSAITVEAQDGATVTGIPATATNGTEVTFTVDIASGKTLLAVKANNNALTADGDGNYKFTVAGDMTVTVTTADEGTPEPELLYTLDASQTGGSNGYATVSELTVNGVKWSIEGNTTTDPWRFGGKSLTGVDRKLTSQTAIAGKVTEVVINFAGKTITVNSVTFNVYKTDPTASGATVAYTKSVTYAANSSYTITVPGNEDWSNCYYELVFNVTAGSSNQYVSVSTITFTGYAATSTQSDATETVSTVEALAVDNKKTVA